MEVKANRNYVNKKTKKTFLVTGVSVDTVIFREVGNLGASTLTMDVSQFKEEFEDAVSDRLLP